MSDDLDIINFLTQRIESHSGTVKTNDVYYDGQMRLAALGLALPPQLRALQTVVNWPRMVVDALEERLDVEGFRYGGAERSDERLWEWWQANRMDEESSLGHTEALVQGAGYIAIGVNEADSGTPIFTIETRHGMAVEVDPRTRRVLHSLRLYNNDHDGIPQSSTLYDPDSTAYYSMQSGRWVLVDRVEHNLGVTPVVPLVNRARLKDRAGRSEMADIIPLTDAACRSLTNLQGAQELLAVPTRYVLGVSEKDFIGADGAQKTTWEAYLGRFLAIANENATMGQLPAADLRNFTETINAYARMVSALSGLPPHFLGFTSENPASADAIRSSEARLVKRAERRARAFGDAWEEAMRIGLLLIDGELSPEARRIETVWRDPATPTFSAKADAVVKLFAARGADGRPLLPREAAWEELGYSAEKRRLLLAMEDADPAVRFLAATSSGSRSLSAVPADDTRSVS